MKFSMHQELSNYALILPFDVKHEFCFAICMFSYVSNNFENWTKLLTFSWSKAFSSVLLGSLSKEVFTVFSLLWKHDDKSYLWPTFIIYLFKHQSQKTVSATFNFVWYEQNVCQSTILTFSYLFFCSGIFTYPILFLPILSFALLFVAQGTGWKICSSSSEPVSTIIPSPAAFQFFWLA